MEVRKALQIIDRYIAQALEAYNESTDSKDSNGNRIPHPLDNVDQDDKLFALDVALKDVALKTIPMSLLESIGSTASELKRVSKDYFVRVPAYPQDGQRLDIDEGLAYAVVFTALGEIWNGFSQYSQKGDMICNVYNNAYRQVISDILNGGAPAQSAAYIMFSADGQNWHDSYQDGDKYISFKKIDTQTWTPAIKFVGDDGQPCSDTQFIALNDTPSSYTGAGGKIVAVKSTEDGLEFIDAPSGSGGASKFTDLTDTPTDYTNAGGKKVKVKADASGLEFTEDTFKALSDTPNDYTNMGGKFVAVKSDASGLEFVDAPSGGSSGDFDDTLDDSNYDASGNITLTLYNKADKSRFYFQPSGDLTISFAQNSNGLQAYPGRNYIFAISPQGANVQWDGNIQFIGDASIDPTKDNLIELFYDGITFWVRKWVYA